MKTYFDSTGSGVTLGSKLGEGGEGAVFEVKSTSTIVAKVYSKPPSPAQVDKLNAMIAVGDPTIRTFAAWPYSLLLESGQCVGFTMPKLADPHPIYELMGPKARQSTFPSATWRYLVHAATNLAAAFEGMHARGIVVGDVNQNNIYVCDDSTVKLIDCDSFQIRNAGRLFHCLVGVPEYQPPELQNRDLSKIERSPNQDNFGLAIMIFQLLFVGRHPFAGVLPAAAGTSAAIGDNIQAGRYFYGPYAQKQGLRPPPGSADLGIVTPDIATLLYQAFLGKPEERPTASVWRSRLHSFESQIVQCGKNASHRYLKGTSCVWCQLDLQTGIQYFSGQIVTTANGAVDDSFWRKFTDADVEVVWRRIASITPPTFSTVPPARNRNLIGRPQPATLIRARDRFWFVLVVGFVLTVVSFIYGGWLGILIALGALVACGKLVPNAIPELAERKLALAHAEAEHEQALRNWTNSARATRFNDEKRNLEYTRRDLLSQRARFDEDVRAIERNRERAQREAFLDQFRVHNATIQGYGQKRKDLLLSFGIETALDVTESKLQAVPGVGTVLAETLLNWRRSVERKFQFDPKIGADPQLLIALRQRYAAEREAARLRLVRGPERLNAILAQITTQVPIARAVAEQKAEALWQAQADLESIPKWYRS